MLHPFSALMKTLLFVNLIFVPFQLLAQSGPSDTTSLFTPNNHIIAQKDSAVTKSGQVFNQLDSVLPLSSAFVDSSKVARYIVRQRDSINQKVQSWQAKQDSLLSPIDTLQQKIDDVQRRVVSFQDSLINRLPLQQATQHLRTEEAEALPEEVTQVTQSVLVKNPMSQLQVPKLTSQLPNLPPPVHAVQEHATAWQQKLSTYPATLSEYKGKASQYITPLNQGSEAIGQQVLQRAPESDLLHQNQDGLFNFSDRQGFAQQQQRAQLQQRVMASAKDHFAEHGEALQDAQEQLGKLKKKYSAVNGDTQQKRSSLQGTPLGKRIIYGGSMQLQRVPSLSIDLSPQLAYQWNKRINSGIGLVYRLVPEGGIKKMRQQLASNNAIYGGRVYAEYEVIRSLLLHGEYERLSERVATTGENLTGRQWQSSLLAGVGKTYQISGKWQGSVLLLYNFRHGQQTIHSRPWVVRFGFQRVSSK